MTPHVTFPVPPGSLHPQVSSTTSVEDVQLVTHLLSLGQMLCEQIKCDVSRLCKEVKYVTQGRAQLCFGRKGSMKGVQLPANTLLTLPVQFGYQVYGVLCVASDPLHLEELALSLPVAQLLAQTCSWLLYTMEQSAFIRGQCQQLDFQVHGPLTRREREVLALMCQGYSQEAIADILSIAPATVGKHRQHIYEQLGVHCERDALLAAYHTGFFSLIDDALS